MCSAPFARGSTGPVEDAKAAYVGALEGRAVAGAAVALPRFAQHAAALQLGAGGVRQSACRCQQPGVAGGPVELAQPAEHDALVVGPGRLAVVGAAAGEAVVDQMVTVDHAAALEPRPLVLGPAQVRRVTGNAVVQGRGELEEQLVRDGVLVVLGLAPPDAAAAGAVPVGEHVVRVRTCGAEVAAVPGQVVSVDPGEAPPGRVVQVVVGEVAALRAEVLVVRVGDGVPIAAHAGDTDIVDDGGQRVGGGPPAVAAEQLGVPVVGHHQGGRRRGAPVAGGPGGTRPGGARERTTGRLAARAQRADALGVPVVHVVHLRAPAALSGRHGRVAEPAAVAPGPAAVFCAVLLLLVAGAAVAVGPPAHRVGVVEVKLDQATGQRGGDRDPVLRTPRRVAGVAGLDAESVGGRRSGDGERQRCHHQ